MIYVKFKHHLPSCIAVVNVEPSYVAQNGLKPLTQAILLPLV